jgi:tRNA-specific adenosine deaminase 1
MSTTQEASGSPEAYLSDRPRPRPRPNADEIAGLVIGQFVKLPRKRKPAVRDTGVHEWTPLTGIVAERVGHLRCLCLA